MNLNALKTICWPQLSLCSAIAVIVFSPWASMVAAQDLDAAPLIFDTDIGNDVDDVLALGMIHSLQSRGECRLLAVTITKDSPMAASFTDAVNTFYGRGEVPVGVCHSGITTEQGKFLGLGAKRDSGKLRYPHDLLSAKDAPSAVVVLRRALAAAEDGSVVFAQVGFSTNLANLLDSKADEICPLSGVELVAKKARLLSIMAGAFTRIPGKNGELREHREYNVIKDISSARKIAEKWPTTIVWSGFEIGLSVPYPHESIERDYGYVKHHPLADAYRLYSPPPHDRPTWDLTSVLYAVRPDRGYFGLSKPGRVTVADDGMTSFHAGENASHRHLKLTRDQRVRVSEALVQLSSQPPLGSNGRQAKTK